MTVVIDSINSNMWMPSKVEGGQGQGKKFGELWILLIKKKFKELTTYF